MEEPVDPIRDMLKEVATVQRDQLRRAGVLADVRGRVAALPTPRASRFRFAIPLGVACAAAAAVVLWVEGPATLSFSTNEPGFVGQAGSVLSARADAEMPVQFSDGSRVALAPGARVTVESVASRGATLALERGRAELRIVHRARTNWVVKAGSARVTVTGTRFWIGWDPIAEELSVEMREGSVVVSGVPGSTGTETLRAGQTLRASRRRGGFEIVEAGEHAPEAPAPAPAAPVLSPEPTAAPVPGAAVRPITTPSAHPGHLAVRSAESPGTSSDAWRGLAAGTHYADALKAAEKAGFESACGALGADDLVLLGDVARLAGDPDRAEQAYRAAHRRFPTVDRSAFALGLTAFEARHRYPEAAEWFETYLRQYPTGPLAREAAGRLLESWHRAGDGARARQAAHDYLARYPSGPHATLANQILQP
jgi:transmembrane sensor